MIDNKNTFPFILSQFLQYLLGQILFAVPLKIVLSQTKFVKRWQTIRTCQTLMMTEHLSK